MLSSFTECFYLLLPVLEAPAALQTPLSPVLGLRFSGLSHDSKPDTHLCRGGFTSGLPLFWVTSLWGVTKRNDLTGIPTFHFGPCFCLPRPSSLTEARSASFSSINIPKAKASLSEFLPSPHPCSTLGHQHISSLRSISICVPPCTSRYLCRYLCTSIGRVVPNYQ